MKQRTRKPTNGTLMHWQLKRVTHNSVQGDAKLGLDVKVTVVSNRCPISNIYVEKEEKGRERSVGKERQETRGGMM